MTKGKKIKIPREIILVLVLLFIKLIIFNTVTESSHVGFTLILTSTIYMIFIGSAFNLVRAKRRNLVIGITYTIISVIIFADCLYYSYFNQLSSVVLLKQTSQVTTIKDSIIYLLKPANLVMIVDIIPVLIYLFIRNKRRKTNSLKNEENIRFKGLSLGISLVLIIVSVFGISKFNKKVNLFRQEFFTYHIADIYENFKKGGKDDSVEAAILTDMANQKKTSIEENKYYGIAKGRNVITIQVESLQNFVINNFYKGQEITPNLNKLLKKDTLYYDRYYQQLGRGNTSDAEFVTHNSLYPAMDGQTYSLYQDNTFYGLPWILKENGYSTKAFHGYKAEFWNRNKAYPNQGFDEFISQEKLGSKEIIGFGLSDKEFFKESMPYLKQTQSPFYAFLVTLTSHHPYNMPEKYKELKLEDKHKDTLFGQYIQSVHYADAALGEFIENLKKEGLYENSIINIYGDHFGLNSDFTPNKKLLTEYLGYEYDYDEMMRIPLIMHIPESGINETNSLTGGQIDFLPTLLNIMGIENKKGIMLGRDLNNSEEGFVAQQTYMIKGSFIDNDNVFSMSRDRIYENSRAWNFKVRKPVDIQKFKDGYEKAIKEINKSEYILETDYLSNFIKDRKNKSERKNKRIEPQEMVLDLGLSEDKITSKNIKEILDKGYKEGFRFFKLDFELTHEDNIEMNYSLKNTNINDYFEWIKDKKDAYFITNIEGDGMKALRIIRETKPDIANKLVPQIYGLEDYFTVQTLQYLNIIFVPEENYKDKEIIDFVKRERLLGINLSASRGATSLSAKLDKEGVFVYVYTVNDKNEMNNLRKNKVKGFYTTNLDK
ncbi:lipoteichoic acid synthase-like YqgS [Gottschalkia purinilytica]|uniref:Lipoteichoic acid synthase-like YqgS n=1 Tax=Gottschalkia purinilytica TaxID=1503 RepID=A0A0L0WAB7_GOTPU|nr:sulfatase-like hydrolase/transferase [Gottschalkia purinilytica]KNF08397.1 lipoteichoic acid synthase-like YqgS [Gottschalkia purinilytica]